MSQMKKIVLFVYLVVGNFRNDKSERKEKENFGQTNPIYKIL